MGYREDMTVDLPECEKDGLVVKKFTVERDSFANFRMGSRSTRPGEYTGLYLNGRLWMSDTDAEKQDHMPALHAMRSWEAKRVLINGLGLGMVLKATLLMDHVEHVDVVDIDGRVIDLIGSHYATDPRVHLHHADAFEQAKAWPAGTRWDVVWSDIWSDLCSDNLPQMSKLNRSYGRRCHWQGCWSQGLVKAHKKRYGW